MIYALVDRAKNAYFRFSFAIQKCAEIVYTRLLYFSMQIHVAVAQQITSNVAQLSTVPDGFPINFFFLSFEQLQKLVIVKHFRDNFRIRYLSTLVARWFSYFVIGCYDKKRERAGLISVIKINCIEIYSVAII